jgi:large repetitive protein
MSRHRVPAPRNPTHHRANRRRGWIAFAGVAIAAVAGLTTLATSASAHDAPPKGTASCQTNGATYNWQVADGTTFVENTGGQMWKITFKTSAGTITPSGNLTGTGDTANGPGFTVKDIPSTSASITVTTTTHWGPTYTTGTFDSSKTITRPAAGCDQTVHVPAAPNVTTATCAAPGSLVLPADTSSIHWSVSPAYTSGDKGDFTVTATALKGSVFDDGKTVETYQLNVPDKITDTSCDTVVIPIAPSITQATCTGPTPVAPSIVPVTTDHVTYSLAPTAYHAGDTVVVTAVAATGFKFGDAQKDMPAGWTFVTPRQATSTVDLTAAPTCPAEVAPTAPTIASSTCTGPGAHSDATLTIPTTLGVLYTIAGKDVSGTTLTNPGPVTVIAKPASAQFLFAGVQEVDYLETFDDPGNCLVLTTPVTPTSADPACTTPGQHSDATMTIPTTPNVEYQLDGVGSDVSGQTLTEPVGSTVTVVATPATGYRFTGPQSVPTTVTFTDPGNCLVNAAPVAPTSTASACTTPGQHSDATLTIPTTSNVVYQLDGIGSDVSGQTLTEPVGSTVTVVATPATGYEFTGAQSVTDTISFTDPGDCTATATPLTPTIRQLECTGPNSHSTSWLKIPADVAHVSYQIDGKDVSGTIVETGATQVTVTAIAAAGYQFDKNVTTSWTLDFTDAGSCIVGITIAHPSFVNDDCNTNGSATTASYTIPSSKNVSYLVEGVAMKSGKYTATDGSKITVTAFADKGYSFGSNASSWTHTFAKTPLCHAKAAQKVQRPHVTTHKAQGTQGTKALASTGVPTESLVVGGAVVLLLGFGFLLAGGVTGRKNRA